MSRADAAVLVPDSTDGSSAAQTASRDARIRRAVHEHHAMVFRLLRRLGLAEPDAEDAQQQVFWVFARNLGRIEDGRDKAFLFGVALRVAHAARQRLGRLAARQQPVDDGALADVPGPGPGADERVDDRRARALLDRLLDDLPEELRVVLVLHDLEEWTMREIATALSVPAGTVASRLRRAREQLARGAEDAVREGKDRTR